MAAPAIRRAAKLHENEPPPDSIQRVPDDGVAPPTAVLLAYWNRIADLALPFPRVPAADDRTALSGTVFFHKGPVPSLPASVRQLSYRKRRGDVEDDRVWIEDATGRSSRLEIAFSLRGARFPLSAPAERAILARNRWRNGILMPLLNVLNIYASKSHGHWYDGSLSYGLDADKDADVAIDSSGGLPELTKKLKELADQNRRFKATTVLTHGAPGQVSFDPDLGGDNGKEIHDWFESASLERLFNTPMALILFLGCNVAKGKEGMEFLEWVGKACFPRTIGTVMGYEDYGMYVDNVLVGAISAGLLLARYITGRTKPAATHVGDPVWVTFKDGNVLQRSTEPL